MKIGRRLERTAFCHVESRTRVKRGRGGETGMSSNEMYEERQEGQDGRARRPNARREQNNGGAKQDNDN